MKDVLLDTLLAMRLVLGFVLRVPMIAPAWLMLRRFTSIRPCTVKRMRVQAAEDCDAATAP